MFFGMIRFSNSAVTLPWRMTLPERDRLFTGKVVGAASLAAWLGCGTEILASGERTRLVARHPNFATRKRGSNRMQQSKSLLVVVQV
jgi:hypothetical protein